MKRKESTRKWAIASALMLLISVFAIGIVLSSNIETVEEDTVILVYKRGINAESLLDNEGFSVLADYDEFMLVSTSTANKNILANNGYVIDTLENRQMVNVNSYEFDLREGTPEIPTDLRVDSYPQGVRRPYLVQFIGPIMVDWQEQLEDMGVIIHSYRHRFNYVVEMDRDTSERVAELEFINWVGIYQPAYKVDNTLIQSQEPVDVEIYTFSTANTRAVALRIARHTQIAHIADGRIVASVNPEHISDIANMHGVKLIVESAAEPGLLNDQATWITQTGVEGYRRATEVGLVGTGQTVTVMDSELHIEHEMFYDPNYDGMPDEEIEPADNHEKILAMYAPNRGMLGAGQYHGTHVTGTVLGNAPPRDEYVKHDGHGMDARVIFQD
ncbi:MAG: hypothetical protein R6U17_00310, partial [Thermoplasmata archaeon]